MILPITAYGHPTLKKVGEDIDKDYPNLDKLIEDMFETMYNSKGVGLAAQQINKAIKLFTIDPTPFGEEFPNIDTKKRVFINAEIISKDGQEQEFAEGCLSIPGISEHVKRQSDIIISYYDENFNYHENEKFHGIIARIIQHEYDHIYGTLFIDHLPNLKRMLLKGKLRNISNGTADVDYRMLLPKKKSKR